MYRLLIVDDEIFEREGLRRQLQWEKYDIGQVDVAENGAIALEKFTEKPYDIVIGDVKMPVMDGLEMAVRMREVRQNVKLLFLSGYDDFLFVKQAIQMRAYDYLLKPVDSGELERKIAELTNLLKNEELEQKREQSIRDEQLRQQLVLGESMLYHFANGDIDTLRDKLGRMGYLDNAFVAFVAGRQCASKAHGTEDEPTAQLKGRPDAALFEHCIFGEWQQKSLYIVPSCNYISQEEMIAFSNQLKQGKDDWTYVGQCFSTGEDFNASLSEWSESIVYLFWKEFQAVSPRMILLKKMKAIAEERFMQNISLGEIAEELHYSPNYLSMIFKKEFNQGFYEYLVKVRMEEAKKMLLERDIKISTLAHLVGYEDSAAFIKRFKSHFGCTPHQYRCKQMERRKLDDQ